MELSKYHCMIGKSEAVCSAMLRGGGERRGKGPEKGLCFLIKVRCRADFMLLE